MLMALFDDHRMMKIHPKKNSITSLIFILKISKTLDKVYNNFKFFFKIFQIHFILEFFMALNLESF
jgi:hypothetical protein